MRVLVVEPEIESSDSVSKWLKEAGFLVELVQNGLEGRRLVSRDDFDLIVVYTLLPDVRHTELVKTLKEHNPITPILLLIDQGYVDRSIKGVKHHADDYLIKPFTMIDLLFRARSLLRHSLSSQVAQQLQMADLVLDLRRRRVVRCGTRIYLTYREFSLLELLLKRQGEVLPQSFIASQVWDTNVNNQSNVIDVAVRRLRSKIDEPYTTKLIHTVRGVGYQLEIMDSE